MKCARLVALPLIAALVVTDLGLAAAAIPSEPARPDVTELRKEAREAYGRLPIAFEENRGQTDPAVKFIARGAGYAMFVTGGEMVVVLPSRESRQRAVVRMALVGGNADPVVTGRDRLPGTVNYFVGRDRSTWRTNVPRYARVELANVYPGVGMVYYGDGRRLEYDFVVAPGADPGVIRLAFDGAERLSTDARGDLVLATAAGELRMHAPVTYQTIGGERRAIASAYTLSRRDDGRTEVGVRVAAWDRRHALVIDPVLSYATYLGGAGADSVFGIAADGDGHAYVTGNTFSTNFPTAGAIQDESFGGSDAFVTKLNAAGTALVYSTYLGGAAFDAGTAIAVDVEGNAYVAGFTDSDDFPVTDGAYQPFRYGGQDAFVIKLGPAGDTVEYSTYLGGSDDDFANAIAIDPFRFAYVTGSTSSADFPVAGANIAQSVHGGGVDAFVTRLSQDGSSSAWSTFLGGFDVDRGTAITTYRRSSFLTDVFVTGSTSSLDFPVSENASRETLGDATTQAFVTKLAGATGQIAFSTYFGGNDGETFASAIAVDGTGHAHIAGSTTSSSLSSVSAAQTTLKGTQDAFVTRFNPFGTLLQMSTYLGGTGGDAATAIAVNRYNGRIWVAGRTTSTDFPRATGTVTSTATFAVRLSPNNGNPLASTLLSGDGTISGNALALDGSANAYLGGHLAATDLATTAGAYQPTTGGSTDGFVVKYAARPNLRGDIFSGNTPIPATVLPGDTFTVSYRLTNTGDKPAGPFATRFFVGERQPLATVEEASLAVSSSGPTRTIDITIPRTQPAGTYRLKLCLDVRGEVDEDDEGDNCALSLNFAVVRPELVMYTVSRGTTSSVIRGSTISIKTKVQNNGQTTAPESIVRFYLSTGTVRSRTDVRLAETASFPSLAAGATSSQISTNVLIPGSTAPGTYRVIGCADGGGVIAEVDETNNCKASPTFSVTVPPSDARR